MTPKQILTTILSVLLAMTIAFQMVSLVSTDPRIHNASYIIQNSVGIILLSGLLIAHLRGWRWSARATVLLTSVLIVVGRAFDPPLQPPSGLLVVEVLLPVILSAILLPWFWTAAVFILCILSIGVISLAIGTPIDVMTEIGAMYNPGMLSLLIAEAVGITIASYLAQSALRGLERANEVLELRVTERTAELECATQEALEANALKSRFVANMSHELRTPLNAIISFAYHLSSPRVGELNERQLDFQRRILSNSDHLLGLINDILDLSKIESGKMDLILESTDLEPLFRGVISTAVGLTKDKQLELILDVDEDLPPVWIDHIRIRQVLLNLLSNAAKFTDQGGITVRARTTGDGFVLISVQDSGIGIALENQARVFAEFQQLQDDLNRSHQGSGLGLPISKRLVELHGGQMTLESTPGVGSIFSFTVPVMSSTALEPAVTSL